MFFKELRSWRLNNLIDYISGKRKARKDLTKPKLKILSKVKGKYKSKIYQIHKFDSSGFAFDFNPSKA